MSISRACYVSCDHCGDAAPVVTDGAREARAAARYEAGFTRQRRRGEPALDLCLKCTRAYEDDR